MKPESIQTYANFLESRGYAPLWKVSYYEKLSPYFIEFLVVWTLFTLHNSIELSTEISTSREDPYLVSMSVARQMLGCYRLPSMPCASFFHPLLRRFRLSKYRSDQGGLLYKQDLRLIEADALPYCGAANEG